MKKGGLALLLLVVSTLFITIVSAQSTDIATGIGNVIDNTVNILTPIITPLLGTTSSGEMFFAKTLLFVLIMRIVWLALE